MFTVNGPKVYEQRKGFFVTLEVVLRTTPYSSLPLVEISLLRLVGTVVSCLNSCSLFCATIFYRASLSSSSNIHDGSSDDVSLNLK